MHSLDIYIWVWIALAIIAVPIQLFVTAPYGRHSTLTWGPTLPNRVAWVAMELVALAGVWVWLYFATPQYWISWIALCLWSVHYLNRAIIYPFRTKTADKRMPWIIMLMAMMFNTINASFNGLYLATDGVGRSEFSTEVIRVGIGLVIFCVGFAVNVTADNTLLNLRTRSGSGYQIPQGGLFRWISCPNFLGEIVEWCGFAVICWNLPSLAFAIWTAANLVPRAIAHHRWYRQEFVDYPAHRKALLPLLL